MVKLKFIIRTGVLVLRISENKVRYYKRVGHLLKGSPNLEKHWVKEKGSHHYSETEFDATLYGLIRNLF